jgi:hypothetical protein
MSEKKFWKLSFYQWSVWLQRIVLLQERRQQDRELLIELERGTMALLCNIHKDKNTPEFKRTDFYKLSYDQITEEVKVTGEKMFDILNERFKNIPIRKRNG